MLTRHRWHLVLLWLVLSALLTGFLFFISQAVLERAVREQLQSHLLQTLDEAQFSNAQNRENDQRALLRMGTQINAALRDFVGTHWYSPHRDCTVQVQHIDDVTVVENPTGRGITFSVPRNQIGREVVAGVSCAPNWWLAAGACALLGLLFMAIHAIFSLPLSKAHQRWLAWLLERGYSEANALAILRGYDKAQLDLNPAQFAVLEHLHDPAQGNIGAALRMAGDPRVAALDGDAVDWFVLGLRAESGRAESGRADSGRAVSGNLDGALRLSAAPEAVAIDLMRMTLHIRGLNVPVSGTPLFYYAWYAMARQREEEGWITNPATNRPDLAAGRELIELMSRYDGHARAINDLERVGLKARTLDQNRSKIKEEIIAALGEKLADTYLFEASKHPDGVHMRYRLRVQAHRIRIVDPP